MSNVIYNTNISCTEFDKNDKICFINKQGHLIKHLDSQENDEYQFIVIIEKEELKLKFRYKDKDAAWKEVACETNTILGETFNLDFLLPKALDVEKEMMNPVNDAIKNVSHEERERMFTRALSCILFKLMYTCLNRVVDIKGLKSSGDDFFKLNTQETCFLQLQCSRNMFWELSLQLKKQDGDFESKANASVKITPNMKLNCRPIADFNVDKLVGMEKINQDQEIQELLNKCVNFGRGRWIFLAKCVGVLALVLIVIGVCLLLFVDE